MMDIDPYAVPCPLCGAATGRMCYMGRIRPRILPIAHKARVRDAAMFFGQVAT